MNDTIEYVELHYPRAAYYLLTYFDISVDGQISSMTERYKSAISRLDDVHDLKQQVLSLLGDASVDWVELVTDPDREVYYADDDLTDSQNQEAAKAYIKMVLLDSIST